MIDAKICHKRGADMTTTITIKILFFASAREAAGGITSANLELDADGADTQVLR